MSQVLFTAKVGINEMRIEAVNSSHKGIVLTCNTGYKGDMAWLELPRRYDTVRGAKLAAARIVGEPLDWGAAQGE
ncbi:hypothetical protein GZ982_30150 (plasmid) [Pseudomonas fluorescens]|nr:hypothetical protein GZ982_30150 [Pseudomonas fluorescens]